MHLHRHTFYAKARMHTAIEFPFQIQNSLVGRRILILRCKNWRFLSPGSFCSLIEIRQKIPK